MKTQPVLPGLTCVWINLMNWGIHCRSASKLHTHLHTHTRECDGGGGGVGGGSKRGCRDKELRQWGVGVGGCFWYWRWWERVGAWRDGRLQQSTVSPGPKNPTVTRLWNATAALNVLTGAQHCSARAAKPSDWDVCLWSNAFTVHVRPKTMTETKDARACENSKRCLLLMGTFWLGDI